jgi:hypothetical protein
MSTLAQPEPIPAPPQQFISPLQNGDHLTADEFERRYRAMPDLKKAELINGVVFMPSPVAMDAHAGPHADLITWLGLYRITTRGLRVGDNATLRLPVNNCPQPDTCLFIEPSLGGQVRIVDDYLVGGTEFVGEVAASSVNYDLHEKLEVYQANNIREYLVWRVMDREIDWFILRNGQYTRLALSADGLYKSEIFPGLWLDPAALMAGDIARLLKVIQEGAATPEHAAFVARLQQSRG